MVSGKERVEQWFASGKLMRPRSYKFGWVDFARAIASHCGVEDLELSQAAIELKEAHLSGSQHVVLILVDGLGMSQLAKMSESSFLRRNCVEKMQSIFPASTAPAITTLVTADYPNKHAITSWWIHLAEHDLIAEVLPFWERFSHKPLEEYGSCAEDVFPVASRFKDFKAKPRTVTCAQYVETAFSRYARSYTSGVGYSDFENGVEQVVNHVNERVDEGDEHSFTYWYLPQYDKHCHEAGIDNEKAWSILAEIDKAIADLSKQLAGKARIIVTADHGQVDVPREKSAIMEEGSPILDCLASLPSGEPSMPVFHVNEGREEEFAALFEKDYGHIFTLLTVDEVSQLELFGPGQLVEKAKERLGTFVALSNEPAAMLLKRNEGNVFHFAGIHGGMSKEEMMIPLVVVR